MGGDQEPETKKADRLAESHAMLAPLLGRCASQAGQDAVIHAWRGYLHNPANAAMTARWLTMVQKLRASNPLLLPVDRCGLRPPPMQPPQLPGRGIASVTRVTRW